MSLTIAAGGRCVEIRRPDKPLFPTGETKADVARHYARVADVMLAHVGGRPLNLQRFPDGIAGRELFQQRAPEHFPDWIERATVPTRDGSAAHAVARDPATLVYLAGQASITPHAWLSRTDRLDRPDRLVFDLDPAGVKDPAAVRRAARDLGALLRDELGLEPFAMATGSTGFHVVVALRRRHGFDDVRAFAHGVARVAAARDPRRLTLEQRRARRGGRILVDIQRNAYGHTAVAPYAVRPRPGAPVAVPLAWEELSRARTRPDAWTIHTLARRLDRRGDPWTGLAAHAAALGAAQRRLDALLRRLPDA